MQLEGALCLIGGEARKQSVVTARSISEGGDTPGRFLVSANEN